MALVKTGQGFYAGTPGNSNITFNFNQIGGGDEFLMALVMFRNATGTNIPTYDGISMTRLFQYNNNSFFITAFGLLNPVGGINEFRLNVSNQWNPSSVIVTSFSGSSGFGVRNQNLTTSTSNSTTLTGLTTGSMIQGYGMSTSTTGAANIQIPTGTIVNPREWRNHAGIFWGATSPVLSVTSSTVRGYGGASWTQTRSGGIEIKASGSTPPPTRRRRIIIN
jgi:hypothetical protein